MTHRMTQSLDQPADSSTNSGGSCHSEVNVDHCLLMVSLGRSGQRPGFCGPPKTWAVAQVSEGMLMWGQPPSAVRSSEARLA
jgi:hypothetical protein